MSTISVICALAEDRGIGKKQELLWRLPNDMKRFKNLTEGHIVVMGRKTFESLPKGALPNRKNIVLTSMPEAMGTTCIACTTMEEAIQLSESDKEIFIIGGASVYQEALTKADKMYLTFVHSTFPDADVHFPEVNYDEWEEVNREDHKADDKNAYDYTFVDFVRKR
ncbi:dihydrofolate reductase [Parabacteroides sp. FAFU027]|uniref:dihydrofolate reductase n=1 Tax=Parabacteroides sp. FAFU027 TaxID=2922715 RepID=UPI001FAFB0BF|nr:dihydrofolate reductase [Parabacteroides sp. FAFU027]